MFLRVPRNASYVLIGFPTSEEAAAGAGIPVERSGYSNLN